MRAKAKARKSSGPLAYLCLAAVFQRWIFKNIFKQERTAEMEQQSIRFYENRAMTLFVSKNKPCRA